MSSAPNSSPRTGCSFAGCHSTFATANHCRGSSRGHFQNRSLHQSPTVPCNTGVLTFARPDENGLLAPSMPARLVCDVPVRTFLDDGWTRLEITPYDARRQFSDLGNQASKASCRAGDSPVMRAPSVGVRGGIFAGSVPLTKIRFSWPRQKGLRQIIGVSGKRKMHWHYAISAQVRTAPVRHIRLSARLIFRVTAWMRSRTSSACTSCGAPSRSRGVMRAGATCCPLFCGGSLVAVR